MPEASAYICWNAVSVCGRLPPCAGLRIRSTVGALAAPGCLWTMLFSMRLPFRLPTGHAVEVP